MTNSEKKFIITMLNVCETSANLILLNSAWGKYARTIQVPMRFFTLDGKMKVLLNQKGEIEQIFNEGAFGDIGYLCTSSDDVKELYNGFYGHTEIELSREHLNRILNGEILFSTIQYEYSVSIKLKPD